MKMMVIGLLSIVALPASASAFAQEYDPAMSAYQRMGEQQYLTQQRAIGNHMLRQSIRRNGGRSAVGVTQRQSAACAQKAAFRAQYGAGDPKVQRLYGLCRSIGR